jgi:opacity protein-like surface antigen
MKVIRRQLHLVAMTLFMVNTFWLGAANYSGGMFFNLGFPMGEFKENIDRAGIGLSLSFTVNLFKSPFQCGLELNYLNYGSQTRYDYLPSVPDLEFEITTSNNIGNLLGFLRYKILHQGRIQPYLDGLAGVNYLWTANQIKGDSSEDVASTTEFDDVKFAYGIGGGVMIKLLSVLEKNGNENRSLFLDIRFRQIWSGKAEYLKEGSIYFEDNILVYEVYESKTPVLSFQTGITWMF